VAKHNSKDSCWIVLFSSVYNLTNFTETHPGGDKVLLTWAGQDASDAFINTGHLSYSYVIDMMAELRIGKLPA